LQSAHTRSQAEAKAEQCSLAMARACHSAQKNSKMEVSSLKSEHLYKFKEVCYYKYEKSLGASKKEICLLLKNANRAL